MNFQKKRKYKTAHQKWQQKEEQKDAKDKLPSERNGERERLGKLWQKASQSKV